MNQVDHIHSKEGIARCSIGEAKGLYIYSLPVFLEAGVKTLHFL